MMAILGLSGGRWLRSLDFQGLYVGNNSILFAVAFSLTFDMKIINVTTENENLGLLCQSCLDRYSC